MTASHRTAARLAGPAAGFLVGISLMAAAAAAGDLPLWLIEDADNRVWVLGSIHLLREQDYPLPEPMQAAYEDAETLVMELDMDALDAVSAAVAMSSRAVVPDGGTLASLMGAEAYARAKATAADAGIDLDRFRGTEPWYAALTITQMQLARHGYDPRYGVDAHLAARARDDGKPVDGLETFEEQIQFFDELPLDLQSDLLFEALSEIRDLAAGMNETVAAWRRGDGDYLADVLLQELRAYPELYDTLVVERNRRWAPRLAGLLEGDGDYLVIVGTLHLVGPDSVLEFLAARGLVATQVGTRPAVR